MKHNNDGFSLVEIVAAIAILGIFFGTACSGLVLGLRMNEKTDAMLQAQLAVSSAVETLMAEGIASENGKFSVFPQKDNNGNYPLDAPKDANQNIIFTENGLYDDCMPELDNNGNPVTNDSGDAVMADRFPNVTVEAVREKIGEDAEFPPYFKVTVTSTVENVTVTTYIREKVVTES